MSRNHGQQESFDRLTPRRLSEDEIRYWVRRVHRLPAVRVNHIVETRDALRRHRYDDQRVLEATVDRLVQEVDILSRGAFQDDSPVEWA